MKNANVLSITDARKDIFNIAKAVQKPGTVFTLTEKGKPKVVMMSAEEFESMIETIEVMHQFPDLKKSVAEAEKEYREGRTINLSDLLAEEGYQLIKHEKKKVSSRTKKKSG